MTLRGMTVIVTGAARGIGRSCAERLASAGADLVLVDVAGDISLVPYALGNPDQLAHTAKLCREYEVAVLTCTADIRDSRAVADAVTRAVQRFGRIDAVVNNAGIVAPSGKVVHEITEQEWQVMLDVDLSGAWRVIRAAGEIMSRQRSGSIVNISSTAGLVGYRHFAAYVAAKHGLIGLTRAAALDYAPLKVRVNAICPGSVRDDPLLEGCMLAEVARSLDVPVGEHEESFVAAQPTNALVEAADVAEAVLWLVGHGSQHVTGSVVTVDGGFTTR